MVKKKTVRKKSKAIKQKEKKVRIGAPNLDSLIEGGFHPKSTNLIIGGTGAGKSILATQFLIEGIKNGETCLYVTFEEKKENFYKNLKEIGWNLEDFEKKNKFIFLEYTPSKINTMLEEGSGEIENIVIEKKVSRIVIDSITSFALLFDDEKDKREAVLSLFNTIAKWNCTSLITLEEDPVSAKSFTSKSIKFEADSIIILYFVRSGSERKRYLEILKMRGTKHSKSLHEFSIGKNGISVKKSPAKKAPIPK